jgi:hypothetical protein
MEIHHRDTENTEEKGKSLHSKAAKIAKIKKHC